MQNENAEQNQYITKKDPHEEDGFDRKIFRYQAFYKESSSDTKVKDIIVDNRFWDFNPLPRFYSIQATNKKMIPDLRTVVWRTHHGATKVRNEKILLAARSLLLRDPTKLNVINSILEFLNSFLLKMYFRRTALVSAICAASVSAFS